MKIRINLAGLCAFMLFAQSLFAQSETDPVREKALTTVSKLVKSFKYEEWEQYVQLSYPGVVKYYGGKNGYLNHVQNARRFYKDSLQEADEELKIIQLENDILEWQCVVQKTRETFINGNKAKQVTYLVGQSKDDGETWKFFDVAHNTVENVIYIMPDIFSNLAIPQKSVVVLNENFANNNPSRSGSAKKKSALRK